MARYANDKIEIFQNWISVRPALSIKMIEKESGIPVGALAKSLMANPRPFPEKHWKTIEPILKKYGWGK